MSKPTNNVSMTSNLTGKSLNWASDLIDLRKTDNTLQLELDRVISDFI